MPSLIRIVALLAIFFIVSSAAAVEYPGSLAGPYFMGSKIYTGAGAPGVYGLDGDFYIDTASGDYYNRTAGAWVLRGNLLGPVGPAGADGAPGNSGPDGFSNLSFADAHIEENVTMLNTTIINMITGNLSAVGSGPDGFSNLSAADSHILINRSEIEAEIAMNRTQTLTAVLANESIIINMIGSNVTAIYGLLEDNRTRAINASLRLADDHISTNMSTVGNHDPLLESNRTRAINASVRIADDHILQNKSDTLTAVLANESAIVGMIGSNMTVVNIWMTQNKSFAINASLRLADDHISTNMSTVGNHDPLLESNRTRAINASVRIADDHILQNKSDTLTAVLANESAIVGMIGSNMTAVNIWVQQNKTAAINASVRIADDHIATNISAVGNHDVLLETNRTRAINASVRIADDHILQNKSDTLAASYLNLSVGGNYTASSIAIAAAEANQTKVGNITLAVNTAILAGNINETKAITGSSTNLTATIQNLTAYKQARANISILAASLVAETTGGATEVAPNATTNHKIHLITIDFPVLTTSNGVNATGAFVVPSDFIGSAFYPTYYWSAQAGTAGHVINMSLRLMCQGDDGAIDTAWGTNVTTTDAYLAAGDLHVSDIGGAVTPGGTASAGGMCWLRVNRAGGDLPSAVQLAAVRLGYAPG
jgi:hypothetical protein